MDDEKKWNNFVDMVMGKKPLEEKLTPRQEFGKALLELAKKFPSSKSLQKDNNSL